MTSGLGPRGVVCDVGVCPEVSLFRGNTCRDELSVCAHDFLGAWGTWLDPVGDQDLVTIDAPSLLRLLEL